MVVPARAQTKISLVLADVDGTLVTAEKVLTARARAAVKELRGAGMTLSKLLSVPIDEIATIGDMPNDVLMFRNSGLGIATENASPEVQAQADAVTASYEDEGFANAVEQFILHRASSLSEAR